jgi:hypothetical protein
MITRDAWNVRCQQLLPQKAISPMRPQDSRFAVRPLTLHQGVGASATLALTT